MTECETEARATRVMASAIPCGLRYAFDRLGAASIVSAYGPLSSRVTEPPTTIGAVPAESSAVRPRRSLAVGAGSEIVEVSCTSARRNGSPAILWIRF